jgi:hypothetical protein
LRSKLPSGKRSAAGLGLAVLDEVVVPHISWLLKRAINLEYVEKQEVWYIKIEKGGKKRNAKRE